MYGVVLRAIQTLYSLVGQESMNSLNTSPIVSVEYGCLNHSLVLYHSHLKNMMLHFTYRKIFSWCEVPKQCNNNK